MENKKLFLIISFTAILFLAFFILPVFSLSENKGNTYSFRFENCTINDALGDISKKSGIDIISNGAFKKEIFKKSYINKNLDSIIADLLRGENCAIVWNYNSGNLHSINLFTFDDNDLKRTGKTSNSINRTIRDANRRSLPENIDVDEIDAARRNFLKSRTMNSRNRPNRTSPASGKSAGRNSSRESNLYRNMAISTNGTTGNVSDTSSVSANIRRTDNNQNNQSGEKNERIEPPSSPEVPETEKGNGLEPPPMPPGL